MKKIIRKTLSLLSLFLLATLISCQNDGDNSSNDDSSQEEMYSVGTKLVFDGVDHIVTRNTLTEARSLRAASDEKIDPNEDFQNFRSEYLRAETGVNIEDGYIELFDLTSVKEGSINDIPSLNDRYKILNSNAKKIATVTLTRQSTTMFPNLTKAAKKEAFLALTEAEIRAYVPNYLSIVTTSELYGENLQDRIKCELVFDYTDDTMKSLGGLDRKYYSKDFVPLGGDIMQVRNEYEYFGDDPYFETHLCDPLSGSRFVRLADRSATNGRYKLIASGEGVVNGKTSDSAYQCSVDIRELTPDSVDIRVKVTKNDDDEIASYKITGSLTGAFAVKDQLENKMLTESTEELIATYMILDSETVDYNETSIPKSVTFSAPYEDSSAVYAKYAQLTFTWDGESSSYKADKDSFVNTYKADFVDLYNSVQ